MPVADPPTTGAEVKAVVDVPFSIAPGMTWDAFWRQVYEEANRGIQQQANELLARGSITAEEARNLVESQRNKLVLDIRNRLSPFGQRYSEILKPASGLKSMEQLVEEKGSIEAVLRSVGKSRQVVNRFAFVSRAAGAAGIVLEITMTAVVIAETPPEQRGRVAAREIGGATGSIGGGLGGMWAGCVGGAAVASPSLVVPFWGEVTEGGACVVGGIAGGLGFGWAGRKIGESAGQGLYDFVTDIQWSTAP